MARIIELLKISESPYINAALSIVAFAIIAKAADYFINKIFRRIVSFLWTGADESIIAAMHLPVFFSVLTLGVSMSIKYLQPPKEFTFYIDGIFYSIVAVLWMMSIIKIGSTIIEHAIKKVSDVAGLSVDIVPLIRNMTKIIIVLATLMIILAVWQINITPLLASAGIVGAGIALASKDTIANFFGGISIFVDKPFKIGDYIMLENGERGEVVAIGIRSTKIMTSDDIMITIPNGVISNSKISNESTPATALRIRIPFCVAYGSDIDLVEKLLVETALEDANIMSSPTPMSIITGLGDHGLSFELMCRINDPALRPVVVDAVIKRIYKKFSELGIGIPYSPSDVYVIKPSK